MAHGDAAERLGTSEPYRPDAEDDLLEQEVGDHRRDAEARQQQGRPCRRRGHGGNGRECRNCVKPAFAPEDGSVRRGKADDGDADRHGTQQRRQVGHCEKRAHPRSTHPAKCGNHDGEDGRHGENAADMARDENHPLDQRLGERVKNAIFEEKDDRR